MSKIRPLLVLPVGTASTKSRITCTALYLLGSSSFSAGLILFGTTWNLWFFIVGAVLGLTLRSVEKVIARDAVFDDEIDAVVAWIRAERKAETRQ